MVRFRGLDCLMKFKYPTKFYFIIAENDSERTWPNWWNCQDSQRNGTHESQVAPPSLVISDMDFAIEGEDIRFGLSAIKGIAGKTMEKLNNWHVSTQTSFEL